MVGKLCAHVNYANRNPSISLIPQISFFKHNPREKKSQSVTDDQQSDGPGLTAAAQ
jgi:hypothetical protein